MALNKQKAPEPEESGDGWLVSYADMMTLIACFFILMMAFANYDPAGFSKKAEELSKSFNKDQYKSSDIKLNELSDEVAKHPDIEKKAKITVKDSELAITFSGSVLFGEKSPDIDSEALPALDTLIDIIRSRDPNYKIIIEGHSDPYEFRSMPGIGSAWELGALRSAKVLARFEYLGFNPQKLVAVTKGDTEPVAENVDEKGQPILENLPLNRRVIIKVIEPIGEAQKIKFGLGVYFNEQTNP
ncbi:OmpA family protein [Bacteriovorax sp. BSW11_IV]|uniref:OmpA/MotB family protein n=1 Tax=Bacteriovorax sp. BSW11_IV TaxID=1353529 RepID=UPI00038A3486|nr:flagellar motor protein MotB [Bacteriovorax sp. BSW11_IV]EQC48909.1 OmpA family protein [Bacteriovorax sp. BSW11_IV]